MTNTRTILDVAARVAVSSAFLSGTIRGRSFTSPEHVLTYVEDERTIEAEEESVIAFTLDGLPDAQGGDVLLEAPVVVRSGRATAGTGGGAAQAGDGGTGGTVLVVGGPPRARFDVPELKGGTVGGGGSGGLGHQDVDVVQGGRSGDAGGALLVEAHERVPERLRHLVDRLGSPRDGGALHSA